jgi:hypothetical protein
VPQLWTNPARGLFGQDSDFLCRRDLLGKDQICAGSNPLISWLRQVDNLRNVAYVRIEQTNPVGGNQVAGDYSRHAAGSSPPTPAIAFWSVAVTRSVVPQPDQNGKR